MVGLRTVERRLWQHQQLQNQLPHRLRHPQRNQSHRLPQRLHHKSLLWLNQNHKMLNFNHLEDHQV